MVSSSSRPTGPGRPRAGRRPGRPRAGGPVARHRAAGHGLPPFSGLLMSGSGHDPSHRDAQPLSRAVQPDVGARGGDLEDGRDLGGVSCSRAQRRSSSTSSRRRTAIADSSRPSLSVVRRRVVRRRDRPIDHRDLRRQPPLPTLRAFGVGEASPGHAVGPRQRVLRDVVEPPPAHEQGVGRGHRRPSPGGYDGPGTAAAAPSPTRHDLEPGPALLVALVRVLVGGHVSNRDTFGTRPEMAAGPPLERGACLSSCGT